jgi:hypothetical protein
VKRQTGRTLRVLVLVTVGMAAVRLDAAGRPPAAQDADGPAGRAVTAPRGARQEPAPGRGNVARLEQLFDRYVLGQARSALGLDAPQMRAFAPQLQRLQAVRRRHARERQRLLNEITQMTRRGTAANQAALGARLDDLEARDRAAENEIAEARRTVEETLTVEQRARFRLFEGRMERRKLELMAQARQQARPGLAAPTPGESDRQTVDPD